MGRSTRPVVKPMARGSKNCWRSMGLYEVAIEFLEALEVRMDSLNLRIKRASRSLGDIRQHNRRLTFHHRQSFDHAPSPASQHQQTPNSNPTYQHPQLLKSKTQSNQLVSNGRQQAQIQTPEPQILASTSAASKPGDVADRARVHLDDMAQSQGSTARGREADHIGQAQHERREESSAEYLLRQCPYSSPLFNHPLSPNPPFTPSLQT